MIDFINVCTVLFNATIYSLAIGLLLFFSSKIISKYYQTVHYWRDYWLLLSLMCFIPLLYGLIPTITFDFSLSLFEYTNNHNEVFQSSNSSEILESLYTPQFKLKWLEYFAIVWSAIIIVGCIYHIIRFFMRLNKVNVIINNCLDIKQAINNLNKPHYDLLIRTQKQHNIDILLTETSVSPFVFQWKRITLVLPKNILNNLSTQQIDLILHHELVHIKNYDSVILLFSNMIQSLLWFNPFIRFFQNKMIWALEANCDNTVLEEKPALRKIYAKLMLNIFSQSINQNDTELVSTFSLKSKNSLTKRIDNIINPYLQQTNFAYWKHKLLAVLVFFTMITFIIQPKLNASPLQSIVTMKSPLNNALIVKPYGAYKKADKNSAFHNGVDLKILGKSPVMATGDGIISIKLKTNSSDSKPSWSIIIEHNNNLHTKYSHLGEINVSNKQFVKAGQLIGYVGGPNQLTKNHLHLEVLKNKKQVDPTEYLKFKVLTSVKRFFVKVSKEKI